MAKPTPTEQIAAIGSGALPSGIAGSTAQLASDTNAVPDIEEGKDPWWRFTEEAGDGQYPIDALRWNQVFPYQLIVVQRTENAAGETTYKPYSEDGESWSFTLPIPPDSLTISMPFASEIKATLDGIVEEHGGAPFRMISLSGTTGVQPLRENALQGSADRTVNIQPGFIPAGTIQAVGAVVDTALRFAPTPNLMPLSITGTDGLGTVGRGSGYYQFRLLQLFFERWAAVKLTAAGVDLRLALAIWKDQAVYLISPQSFDMTRQAGAGPLKYSYRLSAKAWRRVQLNSPTAIADMPIPTGGLEVLNSVLETLSAARDTLIRLRAVIQAVRSDADQILLEPLRETVLFAKDEIGTAITLADLPNQVIKDAKGAVSESERERSRLVGATLGILTPQQAGIMSVSADGRPKALTATRANGSADPLNKVFDNPLSSFTIFAQLEARRLKLAPQTQAKVAAEIRRVRAFRRQDFLERQRNIQSAMADFSDAIGLGSATFDDITGHIPRAASRTATDEDFEALWAMNSALMAFDKLLLSNETQSSRLNAVEFVAGLARANGIAFTTPTAKFAVPFPYGGTLERLAAQHLGNPNRWHEIATLNGLRAPYVDETGFEQPLLTNGSGNVVNVADVTNLFVGQPVTISANNRQRTSRRITAINKITSGFYQVSVNGDPDLSAFSIAAAASLHAYLPDTVNSNQQLFIPSPRAVNPELVNRDVAGVASFQTLLDAGGVDMALTSSGDLIVTPEGDTPWAVGLQNLIQRIRIIFATPRGSLLQHPGVGLAIPPGISTADLSAQQLLESTRNLFAQDPDFSGVFYAQVSKKGPVAQHVVHVGVAGSEQLLPVGLEVVR